MTIMEAIILGLVQGVTEFLPISSSGHLSLIQRFIGSASVKEYLLFDIILHMGTLLAIIIGFAGPLKHFILKDRKILLQILIATLPLFPLVIMMKPIKAIIEDERFFGFGFIITALILFLGEFISRRREAFTSPKGWKDSLIIGSSQTLSIIPCISRSGSTISTARLLGWNAEQAILFSFLLAIPAICGAMIHEVGLPILKGETILIGSDIGWISYLIGFTVSFLTGLLSLKLIKRLASKGIFYYFAGYCLLLGITTTIYSNL